MCRELRSVVGADVVGNASTNKQVCQTFQDVLAGQPPGHVNCQTLPSVFIEDRQHPHGTAIVGPSQHEVVAPYVISMTRPKPNARAVIQPQPPALRLPLGDLETFLPPKAFHALMVYVPMLPLKHCCNPSIPIATILGC